MYGIDKDELFFYIELLSTKYGIEFNKDTIKDFVQLFNEEIELPVEEIELIMLLQDPIAYEETRLIQKSL